MKDGRDGREYVFAIYMWTSIWLLVASWCSKISKMIFYIQYIICTISSIVFHSVFVATEITVAHVNNRNGRHTTYDIPC